MRKFNFSRKLAAVTLGLITFAALVEGGTMTTVHNFAQAQENPHLILYFDVNETLELKDTSKGVSDDYMLISTIAENTFAKWDEHHEAMSFKHYVYNVLLPGDKSNPELKKARQKIVGGFFDWLSKYSHPAHDSVIEKHSKLKEMFKDPKTGENKFRVFRSFYVMLEKLRQKNITFTVILRTFGSDLDDVVKEVEEHPLGVKFTRFAKFEKTKLIIEKGETLEKIEDIFDAILGQEGHMAIQDDWRHWNEDGEKGRSGKLFPYDSSGNRRGIRHLSLFFDDNATGEEQDILHPLEISGNEQPAKELLGKLVFRVNPMEAMLNDFYYINLVEQAIQASCEVR